MRDDEIDRMIDALREIREREDLALSGLARRLGFSRAHLSMIFAGKRRPGLRFIQAVRRRYPRLWAEIADGPAADSEPAEGTGIANEGWRTAHRRRKRTAPRGGRRPGRPGETRR
jgi:transcriptional regulator with XRE-family HTH domain